MQMVLTILKAGARASDIGVITVYNSQVGGKSHAWMKRTANGMQSPVIVFLGLSKRI